MNEHPLKKYLDISLPINPRWLIRQPDGETVLKHRMACAGYMLKDDVLKALVEALHSTNIMLIEGEPGSGKTMLFKALITAFGLKRYKTQCTIETGLADLIGFFNTTLQNQFIIQSRETGAKTLDEAGREQFTRRFYVVRDALGAYLDSPVGDEDDPDILPNALLLDEIDKLKDVVQNALLELFNDRSVTVDGLLPESVLGLPHGAAPPIVIFTSNDMQSGVSAPMRDRAPIYLDIQTPTVEEECVIMKTKFPDVPDLLLKQVLKLLNVIREDDFVYQKPQLRSASFLMESLIKHNIGSMEHGNSNSEHSNVVEFLNRFITYLIAKRSDSTIIKTNLDRFASFILKPSNIDQLLERGFKLYETSLAEREKVIQNFSRSNSVVLNPSQVPHHGYSSAPSLQSSSDYN